MTFQVQDYRTETLDTRPDPSTLLDGQTAINLNNASPGLFFRTNTGVITKVGPAAVSGTAPNPNGYAGLSTGELWFDTTNGNLYVWDGAIWQNVTTGVYTSKFIPPTSPTGLPSGAVWNNSGTLSIVP